MEGLASVGAGTVGASVTAVGSTEINSVGIGEAVLRGAELVEEAEEDGSS